MKLSDLGTHNGQKLLAWHCPGCECAHQVPVSGSGAWNWNFSFDKPSFVPSVFVNCGSKNPTSPACHSTITNGIIAFQPDSTHKLAGKTVEMPEWK